MNINVKTVGKGKQGHVDRLYFTLGEGEYLVGTKGIYDWGIIFDLDLLVTCINTEYEKQYSAEFLKGMLDRLKTSNEDLHKIFTCGELHLSDYIDTDETLGLKYSTDDLTFVLHNFRTLLYKLNSLCTAHQILLNFNL